MRECYVIRLTPEERKELQAPTRSGTVNVRGFKRAQVLLKADAMPKRSLWTDTDVAAVGVSLNTVLNVRKRYLREGVATILKDRYTGHNPRVLDG